MARIKLSPPWITFVSELEQMFKYDGEVHIVYDDEMQEVKVYVDSAPKAAALAELLPDKKEFGNVCLLVTVVPANGTATVNKDKLFQTAFAGNGAFSFVKTVRGIFTNDLNYVVFRNRVVQYWNDDLGDIYGQTSTLYQEIAKHLFGEKEGICFCTDVEEPVRALGAPLGEWP